MMNRHLFPALSLCLTTAIWTTSALAQPNIPPDGKTSVPTFSLVELEKYLSGRTTLTADLKGATIEEVAAALSQSSGQKITVADDSAGRARVFLNLMPVTGLKPAPAPNPVQQTPALSAPLYTISATGTPFWETLRRWQIEARDAAMATRTTDQPELNSSSNDVPNSLGLQRMGTGFELSTTNTLADGRAVSAWPFLIVATSLKRTQEANLTQDALREIKPQKDPFERVFDAQTGAQKKPAVPVPFPVKAPEIKRWSDQLALTFFALPDPKLTPTNLRCEVIEAVDEEGHDFRLSENVPRNFNGSYSDMGGGSPMQIMLASRPDMGKRLVKLRGEMRFSVVTRIQHWETTDLKTPVEDTLHLEGGDFKVQFTGFTESANGPTIGFKAESRGAHLERFWRNRIKSGSGSPRGILDFQGVPQMKLIDEKGNSLPVRMSSKSYSLGHTNPENNISTSIPTSLDVSPVPPDVTRNWTYKESANFSYGPSFMGMMNGQNVPQQINVGAPVKLIVDFPVERREVVVPFEFDDLPLPPTDK